MRVRHRTRACATLRCPLIGTGGALGQFLFEAEQIREEVVAPLCWCLGPDHLDAAGDRVTALAGTKTALPAEALLLDAAAFRLGTHQRGIAGAMRLAESMTAGNQRHRLFVVHRHARERLANI